METLEQSRVCRLCGKNAGLTVKIFDKRENHVKKINSVLPIVVHEMDLLPKHMCHTCNFKLQEFHKFYENCLKTDANLKSQLSWMQGSNNREKIILPMVQISNVQIKTEPLDYDDESSRIIYENENFTKFVQNNCALQEDIFRCSDVKRSSRKRHVDDENCTNDAKKKSKTKSDLSVSVKENTRNFSDTETVRRNLFATEIFGEKNALNVKSKETLNDKFLERLGCSQSNVVSSVNDRPTNLRTLRPRNRVSSLLPTVSAHAKKRSSSTSKNISKIDSNSVSTMKIKLEVLERCARTLRPRTEAIDYSESKRKNPMARSTISQREIIENTNGERIPNIQEKSSIPTLTVKLEKDQDIGKNISCPNKIRNDSKAKDWNKKRAETSLKKLSNGKTIDNSSRINLVKSKSQKHRSSSDGLDVGRRKNVETNYCHTPFYLRSQRGHLRSGRLKQFNLFVEKPKNYRGANGAKKFLSEMTKQREKRDYERPSKIIFKHRDCDVCKARFASAELYMLHGCYANQRH